MLIKRTFSLLHKNRVLIEPDRTEPMGCEEYQEYEGYKGCEEYEGCKGYEKYEGCEGYEKYEVCEEMRSMRNMRSMRGWGAGRLQ